MVISVCPTVSRYLAQIAALLGRVVKKDKMATSMAMVGGARSSLHQVSLEVQSRTNAIIARVRRPVKYLNKNRLSVNCVNFWQSSDYKA